jgi:hypothetical protein
LSAAELGKVVGMYYCGKLLDKTDPQKFIWMGRAAPYLGAFTFLKETKEEMRNFIGGTGKANVVFVIGRALKGHVDLEKRLLFGRTYEYDSHICSAKQALHFFSFQLQSYRRAVDWWTLVGIQMELSRTCER